MKYPVIILLSILSNLVAAQTTFTKRLVFNSSTLQEARRIIRTPDDKYLVAGYAEMVTTGFVVSLNREAIVFKMDGNGTIEWAKSYGGPNLEEFYDVVQVGNYYYCAGYTRSFVEEEYSTGGGPNLIADVFLVKINLDGTLVWAKNMGSTAVSTGPTIGNEIGYRLVPSGQGGVVIMARLNAGTTTNQNSGIIWVDAAGKTRWANQYDLASHASNNELTFSLWKDGAQGYITGGYVAKFGTGSYTRGLLYKVNQEGTLVWDRNTRCSPGIFESQFYGYYNHKTGKIYSTDYYSQTSGSIREIQVCTNMASTGDVPSTNPKAMRYHYGLPNSSTNTFRALIFPVGDGYEQFLMAGNDINAATTNTTKYTTLLSVDEDLNLQWAKKIGVEHVSGVGNPGYLNQVYDMIPCDDSDSFLAVGTVSMSNGHKNIIILRVGEGSDVETCEVGATVSDTSLSETATAINLTKINLNAGCTSDTCWADNRLIPYSSVIVDNLDTTIYTRCALFEERGSASRGPENEEALDFIIPNLSNAEVAFVFQKPPSTVYFEIKDITGDFVYERFWGNIDRLKQGIKFAPLGMPKGEYVWEIHALYEDLKEVERKFGEFKIE